MTIRRFKERENRLNNKILSLVTQNQDTNIVVRINKPFSSLSYKKVAMLMCSYLIVHYSILEYLLGHIKSQLFSRKECYKSIINLR